MAVALRPAIARTKTRYLSFVQRRPWDCELERSMVSITFDDVPTSAVDRGVPVLDEFDARATFYVCTNLPEVSGRPTIDMETVRQLSEAGHEIGCHTASHYNIKAGSAEVGLRDCDENRSVLADATDSRWPRNFSYPFGGVDVRSKRMLGQNYRSLRSTRSGSNSGTIDLNCLACTSLYSTQYSQDWAASLVASLSRTPSWLILYTHGVGEVPSIDTEVDHLAELLTLLGEASIEVATVDEALDRLRVPVPLGIHGV